MHTQVFIVRTRKEYKVNNAIKSLKWFTKTFQSFELDTMKYKI